MLIFLYGQDSFRSRLKLNELREKYLREVDRLGSGLETVAGAKASLAEIAAAAGPVSLLSKKRLIIIEDIFLNKDQEIFSKLAEYFKSHERNDNIIIFWDSGLKIKKVRNAPVPMLIGAGDQDKPLNKKQSAFFKFLSGQKYAYGFNAFSNSEAAAWVKKQAAAGGGKISAAAGQLLVGLAGSDGWRLKNELDKLLNFKAANQLTEARAEIGVEDVNNLVRGSFNENVFALTDAISSKNKALAAKLLDEQVEAGLADSRLLNMFIWQFKILLRIRQALDAGLSQRQIAGRLKLHAFVAQKGLAQARLFSMSALKNIFGQLVRIDYEVKTGRNDYLTGLNMLIARL